MIDEIAIQQLLNRYSEGASRADWKQVLDTFTPDGVWEIPVHNVKFTGPKEITEGMARFSAATEYMLQMNAPGVITVSGDKATARSGIREVGKIKGQAMLMEVHGLYADTIIRTPQGWKFTRRVFEFLNMGTYAFNPPPQM